MQQNKYQTTLVHALLIFLYLSGSILGSCYLPEAFVTEADSLRQEAVTTILKIGLSIVITVYKPILTSKLFILPNHYFHTTQVDLRFKTL